MGLVPIAFLLALSPQSCPVLEPAPELGRRIARLSAEIDLAEDSFRARLEDLAAIDVPSAGRTFDRELRRIGREALCLQAAGLPRELERQLELGVLGPLGYARYRLIAIESVGDAAGRLSALLAEMRAALAAGRPEQALARQATVAGSARAGELTPALLRRMLTAIEVERLRAERLLAVAQPR